MAVLEPPAAVAICYEIADGLALARAAADGATWLLAIANLDPYPLQLQKQFLALAQLRAIETGRDLLSVGNTGPTALISANGAVQWLLAPEAARRWPGRSSGAPARHALFPLDQPTTQNGFTVVEDRRLAWGDRELLLFEAETAAVGPFPLLIRLGGRQGASCARTGELR